MRSRRDRGSRLKKIIAILIVIAALPVLGEKIYRVLSRGLILDKSTGLYWTRCPLSTDDKPVYDFHCKGEKKIYTWTEAKEVCSKLKYEGRSDWRLPTIRELESIIYFYHNPNADNKLSHLVEEVFPNAVTKSDMDSDRTIFFGEEVYCLYETCYQHYWSSSLLTGYTDLIWAVNFNTGGVQWDSFYYKDFWGTFHYDKPKKKSVRCVAGP